MDFLYKIGNADPSADWLQSAILAESLDSAFPTITILYKNKPVVLKNTFTILGKGTYGIVYLYKSSGEAPGFAGNETPSLAVKFFTDDHDNINAELQNYNQNELGHPRFENANKRTQDSNIIPTAVFTGLHIMQLGIPIHEFAPFKNNLSDSDIIAYTKQYELFARKSAKGLIKNNLCYTDFKTENVVVRGEAPGKAGNFNATEEFPDNTRSFDSSPLDFPAEPGAAGAAGTTKIQGNINGFPDNNIDFRSEAAISFLLTDIDAIGCVTTQVKDIHSSLNRIASFPIAGNQTILGYPLVDIIQTWYSALVSSLEFFVFLITKNKSSSYHSHYKVARALVASLNHRFFKKSNMKYLFTHLLFSKHHPIHNTLEKFSLWFPPLLPIIESLRLGIIHIKSLKLHFSAPLKTSLF